MLLTATPTASADYIRDKQWVLDAADAEAIWAQSQGQGVIVAVVDTGVKASLPDLTGQVLPGTDLKGGGGNGQLDTNGHGTHMASIIAGHGHGAGNNAGVMGLAPKAKILPVRVSRTGDGDYLGVAQGIRFAVEHGASVINLSFIDSLSSPQSDTGKAIAYAQKHDVVVVAGAGNSAAEHVNYPARLPGVVAVGAVDESMNLWDDSNYGAGITLTAPGSNIVAADPTEPSGYSKASGTSDATAFVSATAALVRSKFPNLTAGQVINRLIKSATFLNHKVTKVPDEKYGYGIIRPNKALRMDIPAGPKQGPLAQASPSTSTSAGAASGNDSTIQAKKEKGSSSMGAILLLAGVIGLGVVIAAVVGFAVTRNRRNAVNVGPITGPYPQNMGCPPQQMMPPVAQPPYTAPPPNQGYGYAAPPAQPPQYPNPYTQQPPYGP
ncbi:MAG: type VII secretion-associated serine protease mycosin [Streptomyces sp.]|nr:type VII secretion-associated serine protease mycosin [Streptomyces sp.]